MNLPKLLITGSSGVIGTVLMDGLTDSFDCYGVDRRSAGTERDFKADLSDFDQIAGVINRLLPLDYIVHLAGDPHVDASWDSVLQNNIIATRNLYEAARQDSIRRVVFASSNHVTGAYEGFAPHQHLHQQHEPPLISPQDPIRPDSDYGVSKAFGEALARYYCARYGLESICLRIGSVLRDDDPTVSARNRKIWLSHRDLIQLVKKSLQAKIPFGIYYGVSASKGRFWDISNAERELGYYPVDDASAL